MCQDGSFIIDNISFYTDAKTGTELTAEADWKRRGLYIGPQVGGFDILGLVVPVLIQDVATPRTV